MLASLRGSGGAFLHHRPNEVSGRSPSPTRSGRRRRLVRRGSSVVVSPVTSPLGAALSQEFIPKWVAWETTQKCNLKCVHCRCSSDMTSSEGDFTTAEGKKLLEEIAAFSKPVVVLSGGEPLLRKDIFELAEHGTSLGLRAKEALQQLCERVAGNRFLRGLVCPGGVLGISDRAVCLGEFWDGGATSQVRPRVPRPLHRHLLRVHVNCPLCRTHVLDPATHRAARPTRRR